MTGTVIWGSLGALALFRALFRPTRALAKTGAVRSCAGAKNQFGVCDTSDVIDVAAGDSVFSTASAEVVDVGDDYVNLVVQNEPAVLMYQGLLPGVVEGQHVGVGQKIGASTGRVFFSVTQFKQNGVAEFVAPSAWLAVRGQRLVLKNTGDTSAYCAQGREIVVPREAKLNCDLKLPQKAGFALLPVTAELE
jgi:hypothetical protein